MLLFLRFECWQVCKSGCETKASQESELNCCTSKETQTERRQRSFNFYMWEEKSQRMIPYQEKPLQSGRN